MKRILTNPVTPEQVIFAKDLPACPIIGAVNRQGLQTKSFIQRVDFRDDHSHHINCFPNITKGSRYNPRAFGGSLAQALSHPDLDYFLFDTEKELFEWLLR